MNNNLNFETIEVQVNQSIHYLYNSISGIWNSYGCIPDTEEGIFIKIEDEPDDAFSLARLIGLETGAKKISELADETQISECIVLLPLARVQIQPIIYEPLPERPEPKDPCEECPELDPCGDVTEEIDEPENPFPNLDLYKLIDEYAWAFKINPFLVNKILDVDDYTKYSIFDIKEILESLTNLNKQNSIVKLMLAMVNYNFPPHLNWLLNNGYNGGKYIHPIVMYTQIVTHTLSKKDLSNIWQGVMPKIAEEPEEVEFEIEHYLHNEEFFGGYNLAEILENSDQKIELKIFKIKQRAHSSYAKDVVKHGFKDYTSMLSEPSNKWYNYNWPYDNFSLIELLRVDAGVKRDYTIDIEDIASKTGVILQENSSNIYSGIIVNGINDPGTPISPDPFARRKNDWNY